MQHIRNFVVVGLAVLALGLGATVAQASTVSFSLTTLDTFTQLTGDASTSVTLSTDFGGNPFTSFGTTFNDTTPGPETATVGLTGLGLDWSSFTDFSLTVANTNESTWTFQLFVADGSGATESMSLAFDIAIGDSMALSVALTGVTDFDRADIASVWLAVSCDLPCDTINDRLAEYTVSPVPIPPSLAMFGSALIGLVAFGFARGRQRLTTLRKTG